MILPVGLDPGAAGCVVAQVKGKLKYCRLDKSTEQDVAMFLTKLKEYAEWEGATLFCFIERVQPMPAFRGVEGSAVRGSISAFKIGVSYGVLRGILIALGIPFEEVQSAKWQRTLGCLSKGDKNITKAKAQQLFPKETVIHVTADAMLLSEYCRRVLVERGFV